MRRLILILLLALSMQSPIEAAPAKDTRPAAVWDLVRVGMTRSDVQAAYHLERLDPDTSVQSSTNWRVSARLWFSNSGGAVSQVLVTFGDTSPDEMRALLSERYGKPESSRLVELAPSMSRGPGEQATRVQWRRGPITITLDQPSNPTYSVYSEVVYSVVDPNRRDLPL